MTGNTQKSQEGIQVDFSKFKTSDWLIVGGGALAVIAGVFLDWITASGFGGGANAFDFTLTGALPWLLLVASAVIAALLVMETIDAKSQPWPLILLGATGLAALLLLIRVVFNPGVPDGWSRGLGMILTAVAGFIAVAGAVMGFQASGGNLNDLKDINKIKASFGGSGNDAAGSMPPPPTAAPPAPPAPPAGDANPPPPPPAQ